MKRIFILLFSTLFFIVLNINIVSADLTTTSVPDFADDFINPSKSIAKSDNIIYEVEDKQLDSSQITLKKSGSGYVIWRLDDLKYIELGISVFDDSDINLQESITLEVSDDGVSWSKITFKSNSSREMSWNRFVLYAQSEENVKFIKVMINNPTSVPWAIKLDYLELYKFDNIPSNQVEDNTPNTGDNAVIWYILMIITVVAYAKLAVKEKRN